MRLDCKDCQSFIYVAPIVFFPGLHGFGFLDRVNFGVYNYP